MEKGFEETIQKIAQRRKTYINENKAGKIPEDTVRRSNILKVKTQRDFKREKRENGRKR